MEKAFVNGDFNPSGVGLKNGNFIGLPFTEKTAQMVLFSVPWDVTVSFGEGTAFAPEAILEASSQLDLFDLDNENAWRKGIFMQKVNSTMLKKSVEYRGKVNPYLSFLENGGKISENREMEMLLKEINHACENMNEFVYLETKKLLQQNKTVGLIGGDHSSPFGYLKALSEEFQEFGVLQFDAHHDLRNAYEGFTFSHASIFYNALQFNSLKKLVQVGIRDFCEEEVKTVEMNQERISVFYDQHLKEAEFQGKNWDQQCDEIIELLPEKVYISFDVDGFDPKLCPNTGTPVPVGLEFNESVYLLKKVLKSGRKIIGFDVCETGNNTWDANVAARLIYKICCLF